MSISTYAVDEIVLRFILGKKILDVGCGLGRWGHLIRVHMLASGIEPLIIGVDIEEEYIRISKNI